MASDRWPVSGRKQGRPQLDALMQAARERAFDCVLVWKFDRFARSTQHLLAALEEFDYLSIRFVSIQDQIDTTSPMGKAMFTLIGAMAELESSLISERVTAGMKAAKARGKPLGQPPVPIAGRHHPQRRAPEQIDPAHVEHVQPQVLPRSPVMALDSRRRVSPILAH